MLLVTALLLSACGGTVPATTGGAMLVSSLRLE
jgi:hypothetical protein